MKYIHIVRKCTPRWSNIFSSPFSPLYLSHLKSLAITIRTISSKPQSYLPDFDEKVDFKNHQTFSDRQEQSDVFGTLKTPYENNRYRNNSSVPNKHYKMKTQQPKRFIKVKQPVKNESDTFGNLSDIKPVWYPDMHEEPKGDNDLSDDSVIVKNFSRRYRDPQVYIDEMKRLVKEHKVKEALDLFVDMRRNFVTPFKPHYTFMIGACGRVGYTEMAFKLLRQMTDRSLKPTSAVLTGLFNSCAESPFPEYGLKKAKYLKEKIELKNWEMNQRSYHAMIKAFGKCGDLVTSFEIVDEMAKADIKIDVETYSFLLMSCIDNKEAGFTYAVEVWRKMKAKKCIPNVFTCNLLLRATRDCDIGTDEISSLLLQHWSSYSKRPYGFVTKESSAKEPILKLESGCESKIGESTSPGRGSDSHANIAEEATSADDTKSSQTSDKPEAVKFELSKILNTSVAIEKSNSSVPSLLTNRPVNGPEILELVNIKTPSDRLSLIGGMEGFLEFMSKRKIKPNIKTLTLLLDCLPPNSESEEKLLTALDKHQVTPDIDFFNMLIKRRNLRKETEAAKNVLVYVNKYELTPDIMTFGVLAMGCRTLKQATLFIEEMIKFGCCPNIEIAGAMLRNACNIFDFHYISFILEFMEKNGIGVNEKVLLLLEDTLKTVRKNIIAMEQGKEVHNVFYQKNLSANFSKFSDFYEEWLKRTKVEAEKHPWEQYKTEIIDKPRKEEIMDQ